MFGFTKTVCRVGEYRIPPENEVKFAQYVAVNWLRLEIGAEENVT